LDFASSPGACGKPVLNAGCVRVFQHLLPKTANAAFSRIFDTYTLFSADKLNVV